MKRWILFLPLGLSLFLKPLPQQTGGSVTVQGAGLQILIPACFQKAYQNVAFSCSLTAQNGAGGYTFAKVSGSFPTGIADVTSAGVVAGTPTGTTLGIETVQVTDASGTSVTMAVPVTPAALTGTGPCGIAICVLPTALSVQAGQTAPNPVVATCYWSDGTISNSLPQPSSPGSCPPAFGSSNNSIATVGSSSGSVTGVAAGSANVTAVFNSVTSNNAAVTVTSNTVTLAINQTTFPVNSGGTGNMQQYQPIPTATVSGWTLTETCSGCTAPFSWSVTGGTFPTGVSIASATGAITGTPTTTATSVTIQVADSASHTATQTFSFTVATISSPALLPLTPTMPVNSNLQETCTATYSDSSTAPCPPGTPVVWSYVGGSVASALSSTTGVTVSNVPSGNITVCGPVNVNGSGSAQTLSTVTDGAAHSFTILGPTSYVNFVGQGWLAYFIGSITSPVTLTWGAGSQQYDSGCDSFNVSAGTISADGSVASVSNAASSTNVSSPSFTPTATDLLYGSVVPQQNIASFNSPWTQAANMVTVSGAGNAYVLGATAATAMNATQISQGTYDALIQGFKTNAANTGTVWSLSGCPTGATVNAATGSFSSGPQAGTCTIKATAPGSVAATTTITIQGPTDSALTISPASASVLVNNKQAFTVKGNNTGIDLTSASTFTSDNGAAVSISGNTVTCLAAATLHISAHDVSLGISTGNNPATLTCTATATSLLANCSVNSTNAGSTGCSQNVPNVGSTISLGGFTWTVAALQGFETGSLPSGQFSAAVNCTTKAHTGSCSTNGLINFNGASVNWGFNGGQLIGHEAYLSYWDLAPGGAFNEEYTLLHVIKRGVAGAGTFQEYITEPVNFGAFNNSSAPMTLYTQGQPIVSGAAYEQPQNSFSYFGPSWTQWEFWVRASTSTGGISNKDGFIRVYENGTLVDDYENRNLNGLYDFTGFQIEAGGVYTKNVWTNNGQRPNAGGTCSTTVSGTEAGGWIGAFNAASLNAGNCAPAPPTFTRYIDDVILLEK